MHPIIRKLFVISAILAATSLCLQAADQPPTPPATTEINIRELADEVDVLQLVAKLALTEKQVTYFAAKLEELKTKREDFRKREEAILLETKNPLQQMKDALAAGKNVPSSVESAASAKLKELQDLRQRAWQEFQSAVSSCVGQLDPSQVKKITRSPEARSRAAEMVQQVRSASEQDWPKVQTGLTSELLEVKKLDKEQEWQKAADSLKDLTGEERDKGIKELEKRKETELAQEETKIKQMLASIRGADPRILSIPINNLTDALRSRVEVRVELLIIISRILESPAAEAALKARLAGMKEGEKKTAGD
ncbi:MAG TPA: hypothetical protein VMX94_02850 [Armatimonadota bacterium]|nr:hypothetical protein [Armatimonadota bacterium]